MRKNLFLNRNQYGEIVWCALSALTPAPLFFFSAVSRSHDRSCLARSPPQHKSVVLNPPQKHEARAWAAEDTFVVLSDQDLMGY